MRRMPTSPAQPSKVETVETTAATPPPAPTSTVPEVAGTPAVAASPATPQVKLVPKGDNVYPLTLNVVGADDIVFADANDSKTVDAAVGEQVLYLPNVKAVS